MSFNLLLLLLLLLKLFAIVVDINLVLKHFAKF